MKRCIDTLLSMVLGFVVSTGAFAGVRVGHGGTLLFSQINLARQTLVDILKNIDVTSETHKTEVYNTCYTIPMVPSMTPTQAEACQKFIYLAAPQLIDFNSAPNPVEVRLEGIDLDAPHEFDDDDGDGPFPVEAMTTHDRNESIIFVYDRVRDYSVKQMMVLVTHELGHKVEFPGPGRYISDESPIGGFIRGRSFLDTAAAAILSYGTLHGLVPNDLSSPAVFEDWFTCEVRVAQEFKGVIATKEKRHPFSGSTSYVTGIGLSSTTPPMAPKIGVSLDSVLPNYRRNKSILFNLEFTVLGNCSEGNSSGTTNNSIIEVDADLPHAPAYNLPLLTPSAYQENLLCTMRQVALNSDGSLNEVVAQYPPIVVQSGDLSISCTYEGMHKY